MYLIDGNNLWYAAMACPEPLAGIGRGELVGLLERFAGQLGERMIVVLDGHPPPGGAARCEPARWVERLYAAGLSADAVICRLVAESTAPRRLTVVSSDRGLLKQVRGRRVRVVRSEPFAARLLRWLDRPRRPGSRAEPAGKTTGLGGSGQSLNDWLRYFGLGRESADIISGEGAGARGGRASQSGAKSESGQSPDAADDRPDLAGELGRAFGGVQPLKRRRRRPPAARKRRGP